MIDTSLFYYGSLLIMCCYAIMICRWSIAWILYPETKNKEENTALKISVIVAARNEQSTIPVLLNCLKNQQYQQGQLEIIISDDFSDDETRKVVSEFISLQQSAHTFRLLTAEHGMEPGKKAALARAIEKASGTLIITTDADCTMEKLWVQSFASYFLDTNVCMVTGFVRLKTGNSYFGNFQALEFLSLSGTSAATVILGHPLMCNGANLAFTREAFIKAGGYQYGSSVPTGDDTFLMLRVKGTGDGKIVFNKNTDGIVTSIAAPGMKQFISQRIRWASKVGQYREKYIPGTGMFLFLVNLILVFSLFVPLSEPIAILWLLKIVPDLSIIYPASRFAKQQYILLLFLPAVMLYPFYALAGMILSLTTKGYTWKGRTY